SGWRLGDDDAEIERLFAFPPGTLLGPGTFLTLFGGGAPSGVPGLWFVDDGRIGDGLSNAGDTVILVSPDGRDTLDVAHYTGSQKGVSLVREEGDWVLHNRLPRKDSFSPGVAGAKLGRIRLAVAHVEMAAGESTQLTALGGFDDGSEIGVTEEVTWSSDNESVVEVNQGLVTGLQAGNAQVQAGFVGVGSARAAITVLNLVAVDSAGTGGLGIPIAEDTTGTLPGAVDEPVENRAPVFVSSPDTVALAGVGYRYTVRVEDPEGDSAHLRSLEQPGWLNFDGESLEGVPTDAEIGLWRVVLELTDGQETVLQPFEIQVVGELFAEAPDTIAVVGQTWRARVRPDVFYEIQVDGGPILDREAQALIWKPVPEDEGVRWVLLAISGPGMAQVVWKLGTRVLPAPLLKISEILVSGLVGGERPGESSQQFIELLNAGSTDVNLSGWTLGDDDGQPFRFPKGVVLLPGERVTVRSGGASDPAANLFSAGEKIGNGLAASDRLLLVSPSGPDTVLDVSYAGAEPGTSLVPDPERPNRWVLHSSISDWPFSPGEAEERRYASPAFAEETIDSSSNSQQSIGDQTASWELPSPNPFHTRTTFGFRSSGGNVQVRVYSALGQPVRTMVIGALPTGRQMAQWDGLDDKGNPAATGVYLIQIRTGEEVRCGRVVLLR
ncbi:MAG: lamin tail domain-containing protein, partial [bacterium]|nr:lamin tail domain-containing protein [bacterium]